MPSTVSTVAGSNTPDPGGLRAAGATGIGLNGEALVWTGAIWQPSGLQPLVSPYGNSFDGVVARMQRASQFSPIRMATYGDSRANIGGGLLLAADGGYSGEKTPAVLSLLRGDLLPVFNGGISGDTAANWNSASRISGSQAVTDCIAATPDVVVIQYGINDFIAGTSAATVYGYLQALITEFLGAGIFVVFESTYTCAKGPATYINGYSSSGGFSSTTTPAEYNARLAEMQACNALMQTWLAGFPGRALYVETNATLAASDGFAKTDGTWYDGTHLSQVGCRIAARLINIALAPYFGSGLVGKPLKLLSRNAVNDACITVSSGRAAGYSAGATETGTLAYSYQVVQDASGEWCQEYTITNTTAAGTAARARLEIVPSFVGAGTYPVLAAADQLQASVQVYADNGAGGAPPVHTIFARARVYYNDATNEYAQAGGIAQQGSTDHPGYSQAETLRFVLPRRAVKAAMSNSTIIAGAGPATALALIVCMNQPGTVRLRVKRAAWGKVA